MANKKTQGPLRRKPKQSKPFNLPQDLQAVFAQARTAHQQGRGDVAKAGYEHVLARAPKHAQSHFLLAILLMNANLLPQSEVHFLRAQALSPTDADFNSALGNLYSTTKQYDKAAHYFTQALNAKPDDLDLMANLSGVLLKLKQYAKAKRLLSEVLARQPQHKVALNNMASALFGLCDVAGSTEYYQRAITAFPERFELRSNFLMGLNYLHHSEPNEVFQAHASLGDSLPAADTLLRQKKGRLRVAYLSGDFRQHSVAYFLLPLLRHHDKARFEIYCYYNGVEQDAYTEQFKSLSDQWRDVAHVSDSALCQQVRADSVDIVVELSGHSGGNRMLALAARMAPVQVSWLGYPHSTGIPAIDYRIVDAITDPEPEADRFASETLIRLPDSFLCYQGDESVPYEPVAPCVSKGYVTFGCFNNLLKVNEDVLSAWSEILNSVPDSRMIIKAKQLSNASVLKRVKAHFEAAGVGLERVQLSASIASSAHHLALYNSVDLALDTFPYNGTTTTFEALWMGVPTLCILGDRHAARVSASIMGHVGLDAFVCDSVSAYCQRAKELANNAEPLKSLRPQLREQLKASRLCDAKRFAQSMEQSYCSMLSKLPEAPNTSIKNHSDPLR